MLVSFSPTEGQVGRGVTTWGGCSLLALEGQEGEGWGRGGDARMMESAYWLTFTPFCRVIVILRIVATLST